MLELPKDQSAGRREAPAAAKRSGQREPAGELGKPWSRGATWLACTLLVVATLAAYSSTLRYPFLFDDGVNIVDNASIRQLWPVWRVFVNGSLKGVPVRSRPLVNLSLAVNYAMGELDPLPYHVTNVAIHVLAGLALFGLVRGTLTLPDLRERYGEAATPLALVIAAVWMLHPLQTQAVTYLIQRCESMMGLFFLLALYSVFLSQSALRPRWWEAAAVLACLASMTCKEVAAAAPLVILLYDRAFLSGSLREAWRRRRGMYLGLGASWAVLGMLLVWSGGPSGVSGRDAGFSSPIASAEYARSQLGVILHYLRLSFWPQGQVFDYGWPIARTAGEIVPGAVVVFGLLAATAWACVRYPKWGLLGAAFFLILAPSSSLMPIADLAVEHRMYLPLAPVVVAAVILTYELLGRLAGRLPFLRRRVWTYGLPAVAVIVALGIATYSRNQVYSTSEATWRDVIAKVPGNARGFAGLGFVLQRLGRDDEALELYHQALALDPRSALAHNGLGILLNARNRPAEAIPHFLQVLQDHPDYADAHNDLGDALNKLGRPAAAIPHFEKAIALRPASAVAHNNLGVALEALNRRDEALAQYQQAVQLDPRFALAHCNLADALCLRGKLAEAVAHYRQAVEIDPQYADAYSNLAVALNAQGQSDEAIRGLERALEIQPGRVKDHCALAAILNQKGRFEEAIPHCRRAIEIQPGWADGYYHLGRTFYLQGKGADALAQWREALRLEPKAVALLNLLAWELATCPKASLRNGAEAVELARRACQLESSPAPELLDTLAAALAETGRFAEAVRTATEALTLASQRGDQQLADALRSRVELYKGESPFRDPKSPIGRPDR